MTARRQTPARRIGGPALLTGLGLLLALGGLVAAQVIDTRAFLYGLLAVGAGLGLLAAAAVFLAVGWDRVIRPGAAGAYALGLGLAGAAAHLALVLTRPRTGSGPPAIVMSREIFLGVPPALALLSLLLGAHVVYRSLSLPPGGLREPGRRPDVALGGAALAASLYTLGPLLGSLGVPLNHWTFLTLVALGFIGFLVASLLERVF
jgi:hypothetical protein